MPAQQFANTSLHAMPPKRKNARTLVTKAATTPSETVFFYHLNVKPYHVFYQWKPSLITIPVHILLTTYDNPSTQEILNALDTTSSANIARPDKSPAATTLSFTCAEQAYMFLKALYFRDASSCSAILATRDPGAQKALGQKVSGFSDASWDTIKSRVARTVNWYKFTSPSNAHAKAVLLGTAEKEIAEASSSDRVWGIGYKEECAEKYRKNWGENRLGRAIMDVRTRIRECERRDEETGVRGDWEWDGGDEEGKREDGGG